MPDYFQNDVHERMFYYVAHHQPQCDDDNALCGLAAIASSSIATPSRSSSSTCGSGRDEPRPAGP
ncbi:MAG: hypothetical protein U0800_22695 [Isosphaeraceae bacterium]